MTSSAAVPLERETLHQQLSRQVEEAKRELLRVMQPEHKWVCPCCRQPIDRPQDENGFMRLDALWAQVELTHDFRSSIETIAHCDLTRTGEIEVNTRWQVRLPQPT